jgi:hypothetical protein
MGKLKSFTFTGEVSEKGRFNTATLKTINISYLQLLSAHKERINSAQLTHKKRIMTTHNDYPLDHAIQASGQNVDHGQIDHENKVISINGNKINSSGTNTQYNTNHIDNNTWRGNVAKIPPKQVERIQNMTDEEWLTEFEKQITTSRNDNKQHQRQ